MSVFRRYNEQTKQWEPVASADATTVFSGNPILTEGKTSSVEDILVKDRSDIELLKKNVSWLAKHGGGGGFGPGGTVAAAEVQVLSPVDNTTPVNSIIWKDNIQSVSVKVVSSYSGDYHLIVRINGKNVYEQSGVKRNKIVAIPASNLNIGSNSVTMQVLAYDESEMEYSTTCKISIASITLQKPTTITLTQNQLLNSQPNLNLTYRTSIPGNYRMYYSDTMITYDPAIGWRDGAGALDDSANNRSQYIDMIGVGTTVSGLGINLTDIYGDGKASLISKNAAPGIYARYFVMVSANDPTICSSVVAGQINVTVTNGLLISPQFGTDPASPYSISLDSVLNLSFITYSNNMGTYSYEVWCGDKQISETRSNNIYGILVQEKISMSSVFDKEGVYKLTIKAKGLSSTAEADVHIRATRAMAEFVTAYKQVVDPYTIFDFTIWDNMMGLETSGTYTNPGFYYANEGKYKELSQNICMYNKGVDSGSTRVYYKMHHTCCGRIDSGNKKWFPFNGQDTESLIPGSSYQFTLSLAYRINQEVDDNATVFYLGNYNPVQLGGDGTGAGILITAHGYYIRIDGTSVDGVLSDNDFTQLDIVMKFHTEGVQAGYTTLYIYQNGILLQATQIKINNGNGQNYSLYSFKEALIGCRSVIDRGSYYETEHSINMDLYSVRLHTIPLNDGQIICSYINNYANFKRLTEDNSLDPTLISRMLYNNSISADADVPVMSDAITGEPLIDADGNLKYDQSRISKIYDIEHGTYNWGVSVSGNDIVLGDNLQNLPMPIVAISGLNWKYSEFTSTSTTLAPTTGKLRYIDGSKTPIESEVEIKPQGTTTLNYNVKNIDITFQNCLFSPKASWFPEQTFTCKADVVDSGHLNNAVIGTFVNDCLNQSSANLINKDAFPAAAKIASYRQVNGQMMPNEMTLKATIEGFPVLLILDFVSESGDVRNPKVMGVYSFNLGRKSHYNQGFEILKCLRNINNDIIDPQTISFPSLFGIPQSNDKDTTYKAYCFEGARSFNNSMSTNVIDIDSDANYDYASVLVDGKEIWLPVVQNAGGYVMYNDKYIYDDSGNQIPWDSQHVKKHAFEPDGYFWSNHQSYASSLLWDINYDGGNTNEAWQAWLILCRSIAEKLQYTKGSAIRAYNTTVDQYEIKSAVGEALERKKVSGVKFNLTFPQAKEELEFSIQNAAFYYVVCMLFGLVDNFGKNMQFKNWTADGLQPRWSPTFYDMDTALGLDNTGSQTIPPTVFDESIINTPANKVAFMFGTAPQSSNGLFTVYSNKLWGGIDNMTLQKQYKTDYGNEEECQVFSKMWSEIRTSILTNVEDFINKYLHTQLHDCGEFMYNYDYNVKYLSTSQIHMLHGNRLSFIKNWLTERVVFLDSVFGYKYTNANESKYLVETADSPAPYITPYNVSWKNQIDLIHNSKSLSIPIKTNRSLIMRTNIGNKSISYVYAPKNTTTYIPVADSLDTKDIQTWVNNSDCIIDINLSNIDITNIVHQNGNPVSEPEKNAIYYNGYEELGNIYYQIGSFSSLKKLDLRNTNLKDSLDMFKLFKTWDTSPCGIEPYAFALQELNLSGVKSSNMAVNLDGELSALNKIPNIYRAPFSNITSIDVSNSNISSVSIPSGVSLYNLNVTNSNVQTITLNNQPLLGDMNFAGCKNLETVTIINCNRFTNLTFDESVISLKSLTISNCQNLETLSIDGISYKHIPEIAIENCPNLKSITIKDCTAADDISRKIIILSDIKNLEILDLSGSHYTSIEWDGIYEVNGEKYGHIKLAKLLLSESTVDRIYNRNTQKFENNRVIDLLGFSSNILSEIKFSNNKSITSVYFDNIESAPFKIITLGAFSGCSSLERVYGNIEIGASRIFYEDSLFSIHGSDIDGENSKDVLFNGKSVKNGKSWMHPTELNIVTDNGVIFQPGENVTNMRLVGNSIDCFRKTACTTFDAYYILQNISKDVLNISYLFSNSKVDFSWGEDFDNSPHRNTFSKCGSIRTIDGIFEGSIKGSGCRLYSPYIENGEIIPGLFTPLKSVNTMVSIFGNMPNVVCDRNLLRTMGDSKFSFTSIKSFSPRHIVDDVRNVDFEMAKMISENPINPDILGNMSGFFRDCPKLSKDLLMVFESTSYINYDKFNIDGLGLPEGVTTLVQSIHSDYASGDFNLDNIFNDPQYITDIYSSFIVRFANEVDQCVMNINNDTFKNFINLENIGYIKTGSQKTTIDNTAFSGEGLNKVIATLDNSFPYEIIQNNTKLKSFVGFFKDCDLSNVNANSNGFIELPGGMFNKSTLLEDISYCFYGLKTKNPISLSSDMPFRYCSNLKDVSYLFGANINNGQSALRNTNIPAKFFYHGEMVATKTISGTNYEYEQNIDSIKNSATGTIAVENISTNSSTTGNVETIIDITKEYSNYIPIEGSSNKIIVTPATSITKVTITTKKITNSDGTVITTSSSLTEPLEMDGLEDNKKSYSFTYSAVNANIENMKSCFYGADIRPYVMEWNNNIMPESCPDFQPFKYAYENGRWKEVDYNNHRYTYMWVYDGNRRNYYKHINNSTVRDKIADLYPSDGYDISDYLPDDAWVDGISIDEMEELIPAKCLKPGNSYNGLGNNTIENLCGDSSENFCTPPDLFRYCKSNANITEVFMNCGMASHNFAYPDRKDVFDIGTTDNERAYGLKGRLCPYLLKPLPDLGDLSNTFYACGFVGGYEKEGKVYMIPDSFFSYINSASLKLFKTFAYWIWPLNTHLNVFRFTKNMQLNVESAFETPLFSYYYGFGEFADGSEHKSGRTNLSNVFTNELVYVDGMARCFMVNSNVTGMVSSTIITDQAVTFNSMFNRYNKNSANSDYYVFCGYDAIGSNDPDKNERFTNKTLRTDINRHNYDARVQS